MKCQNTLIVLVRATELHRVARDSAIERQQAAGDSSDDKHMFNFFSIALLGTTQRSVIANYLILRRILQEKKQPNSKDTETKKFVLYILNTVCSWVSVSSR